MPHPRPDEKGREGRKLDKIYEWIQNVSVYLIMVTAVMHIIPGKDYRKYVRFFSGLILILLIFSPVMKLTGLKEEFEDLYRSKEYEMERKEIEQAAEIYGVIDLNDFLPENAAGGGEDGTDSGSGKNRVEVEEIRIGE